MGKPVRVIHEAVPRKTLSTLIFNRGPDDWHRRVRAIAPSTKPQTLTFRKVKLRTSTLLKPLISREDSTSSII